jgi:hypothetical protein
LGDPPPTTSQRDKQLAQLKLDLEKLTDDELRELERLLATASRDPREQRGLHGPVVDGEVVDKDRGA